MKRSVGDPFKGGIEQGPQVICNETFTGYYVKRERYGYDINLVPSFIRYIQNTDFFMSSGLTANLNINRSGEKDEINNSSQFLKKDLQRYRIEIGLGYGKIRNVTPLVQAARFQNRLMVLNKLNTGFNEKTMLALARQFSKSNAYNTVYERPAKYF